MTGQKIDGIEVSKEVKEILKRAVHKLKSEGLQPCLATILVGDDPASMTYVRNKHKACESVGIKTKDYNLSNTASQVEVDKIIDELNNDREVHGVLVQLPLPTQLNEFTTISRILPIKDVDGLTPQNVGLLSMGKSILKACTPSGIMEMFYYYKINLEGKNVVMINRSNLIGKPLYNLLLQNNATVITWHDGKLVGDTDYDDIIQKASWATPVPGGVGPMTVAMLLKNTVTAASLNKEIVG